MEDLTSEAKQALCEANLVRPSKQPSKRSVSGQLFTPPPSSSSDRSDTSYTTSISFHAYNRLGIDRWFDFPTSCKSVAALEHIGFTTSSAQAILERYQSRPDDNPDTLLDYACGHIKRPDLPSDPPQMMILVGIWPGIHDAILNPEFFHKEIFWSQSVELWVEDTIRINLLTLEKLNTDLEEHAISSDDEPAT
ncbi:hypothetical protein BU24DRAFT_484472 [Aaosphaeria arxii CBS 175.79]|uniref:Uncharacterized protein n=1 Tax=Aaosphaeria arxii CBS 175.79 TaxID=1450172 RepID=A0A6A5XIG1_9PLEO|nr:uncharacterized protein BU24DRAFT_484472 [Aaosphaeria arxii CBS 175.79]KAF2012743.1 hypothetical protein BU24DRAFT_484472 [Aaosphaeria arxii CBS 175.79]